MQRLLLLGDTDGATTTTGSLGVLTTHTQAPIMTKTAMRADLLQAFQIITKFRVQIGGSQLGVFAIDDILLSVQEPVGHFVLQRVGDDGDNLFNLLLSAFTGTLGKINIIKTMLE